MLPMTATYTHPKPSLNRLSQWAGLILLILLLLGTIGQVITALVEPRAFLLFFGALLTLALTLPVIMLLRLHPAITLDEAGLTVHPTLGTPQHVRWDQVRAVKLFPLLPNRDTEVGRQILRGRKRYRAARGLLLVLPTLSWSYRVSGWFCGEGWTSCIGVTSRAHRDYDQLEREILRHIPLSESQAA